jgi:cobalt-zinc-cadmium efflux system protein
VGAERVALSAHVVLSDGAAWPRALAAAQRMLARDFGIGHVTLQPAWPLPPPAGRVIPVAPASVPDAEHGADPRLH